MRRRHGRARYGRRGRWRCGRRDRGRSRHGSRHQSGARGLRRRRPTRRWHEGLIGIDGARRRSHRCGLRRLDNARCRGCGRRWYARRLDRWRRLRRWFGLGRRGCYRDGRGLLPRPLHRLVSWNVDRRRLPRRHPTRRRHEGLVRIDRPRRRCRRHRTGRRAGNGRFRRGSGRRRRRRCRRRRGGRLGGWSLWLNRRFGGRRRLDFGRRRRRRISAGRYRRLFRWHLRRGYGSAGRRCGLGRRFLGFLGLLRLALGLLLGDALALLASGLVAFGFLLGRRLELGLLPAFVRNDRADLRAIARFVDRRDRRIVLAAAARCRQCIAGPDLALSSRSCARAVGRRAAVEPIASRRKGKHRHTEEQTAQSTAVVDQPVCPHRRHPHHSRLPFASTRV